MSQRVCILATCRNEAHLIPFFVRHYSTFADNIVIWDDKSDDGSRELLAACPKVILKEWGHDNGLDDHWAHEFWYRTIPEFSGQADWIMLVDMDEFVLADDPQAALAAIADYEVGTTAGFQMVGDAFPVDDGASQIYDIHRSGIVAPIQSKAIIVRPSAKVGWNYGRHQLENCQATVSPRPYFKLLHYRFIGRDYTASRNGRNYDRCGLKSGEKGFAWSCSPTWKGEHSAEWADSIRTHGFDVVSMPIDSYPTAAEWEAKCRSQLQK